MENILERLFEDKAPEDLASMLVNLNRFQLNNKQHIKKYNKIRKLHSEIINNMESYLENGKYDIDKYFKIVSDDIIREINALEVNLDSYNLDDRTILDELFIYKNHNKIPSLTDLYLSKNKFRSEDKIKMLESMKKSYVGLFKVIDVDRIDGYVTYENVFTHKKFKVIDIAMSSTLKIDKKRIVYTYNRIITFDDISFGTGIHCIMTSEHKKLNEFIKKHKYNKCSDFSRCLILYYLSKDDSTISVNYNNQYGYRR